MTQRNGTVRKSVLKLSVINSTKQFSRAVRMISPRMSMQKDSTGAVAGTALKRRKFCGVKDDQFNIPGSCTRPRSNMQLMRASKNGVSLYSRVCMRWDDLQGRGHALNPTLSLVV